MSRINEDISESETFNNDNTVVFLHVKLYASTLYTPELLTIILFNISSD